jgi:hypothetical protein
MSANAVVLMLVGLAALVLSLPRVRHSRDWRATVTPLASIIGSGFLVLAPLLVREFGHRAVWVMAGLCGVSYLIGSAIRFNIGALSQGSAPAIATADLPVPAAALERVSQWALAFAYVISVCYYLNLFGAFALTLVLPDTPWAARALSSGVIVAIATLGWTRGLAGLERAESVSVALKLSVIAGLLGGMGMYTWGLWQHGALQHSSGHFDWNSLRLAFGLIITVQGFETSRYLREGYDAATRVRTMRYAQWLSAAIYLVYIGFAGLDFDAVRVPLKETAVIGLTAPIASLLPMLLVLAALAAQFSAAVADTNGCGGLVQEMSRGRVPSRMAYVGLAALALLLTWAANIYEIISYASRAFALYYALQCALATWFALARGARLRAVGFGLLTMLMLAATVLGLPAE